MILPAKNKWNNPSEIYLDEFGTAKGILIEGQRQSSSDQFQKNWERVLAVTSDGYAQVLPKVSSHQKKESIENSPFESELQAEIDLLKNQIIVLKEGLQRRSTVLESLEGYVDQIEGETAYVTLKSEHGDELIGEYPAADLLAKGIKEHRRFTCQTIERDGNVYVEIESIPDVPITEEQEDLIQQRLDKMFSDDDLDGDY